METERLRVDAEHPDEHAISRAAALLRAGELVAFPTETVYGLGANALNAAAVARIYAAKGRPVANPLIVHVASLDAAKGIVSEWPETARKLAVRFWPGPLTMVLPRNARVPDLVTAGGPTVAVRMPAHPVALALIRAAGVPIAAPSANRSSRLSPTRAEHVLRGLGGRISLVLDGGPTTGGLESTVLSLAGEPRLLRPGPVGPTEIEEVIGPVLRAMPATHPEGSPLPSPGLLRRHYAPRALLELAEDDGRERASVLCRQGLRVGWLPLGGAHLDHAAGAIPGLKVVAMPGIPSVYAARLYDTLHILDDAGVDRIVAQMPPDTEAWLAVRDRLRRAAAKE